LDRSVRAQNELVQAGSPVTPESEVLASVRYARPHAGSNPSW